MALLDDCIVGALRVVERGCEDAVEDLLEVWGGWVGFPFPFPEDLYRDSETRWRDGEGGVSDSDEVTFTAGLNDRGYWEVHVQMPEGWGGNLVLSNPGWASGEEAVEEAMKCLEDRIEATNTWYSAKHGCDPRTLPHLRPGRGWDHVQSE